MCGIVGVVRRNAPVDAPTVAAMAARLTHRGPDDDGVFVDGNVGFGHRRLAVIDLSPLGHQPMTGGDGRYVINYNGELYNYAELRPELQAAGWSFRSQSDTEVVLAALATWGEAALPRLNGMFALAFHDRSTGLVTLARDRYGIKPLYLCETADAVLFASEIKAFLAYPGWRAAIDERGLVEYFTFQNFFSDRTLFAGVRMLAPGTVLRIGPEGAGRARRWWDFAFTEPAAAGDAREYADELDRLMHQAVTRQLVADVDVSAYLSGGMDSGAITAIAARQLPNLRSFTVGFDLSSASGMELAFDERPQAERMSYLFGTEHYEMVLKAGDMQRCLDSLIWHLEEPRIGQSYPNYYAAKLAARFGKVVLSGAGGDEIFGGYPWRYYRAVVNTDFENYVDKYFAYWQRLVPPELASAFFSPMAGAAADVDPRAIFRGVFAGDAHELTRPEDYVNHSLYFECRTFLHGLLVLEDKLSMAHGLEARVPFLDNDLVDFAQRLPVGLKLGNLGEVVELNENEPGVKTQNYFARTRDGKLLLREVMARHVPAEVAGAPKQGFSGPDASWFRGESIEFVRARLLLRDSPIYEWLDRDTVHTLVNDHLAGRANRRLLVWSLLCFDRWCDVFLGGAIPA